MSSRPNSSNSLDNKLDKLLEHTLDKIKKNKLEQYPSAIELEVRFGTKNIKPITKINYDNVVQKLTSLGFEKKQYDSDILRCQSKSMNMQKGYESMSNIRCEINGIFPIQKFCRTNDIKILDRGLSFHTKNKINIESETYSNPLDYDDFNFRVTLSTEKNIPKNLKDTLINEWSDTKHTFRLINRVTYTHDEHPFKVDLSMVRNSKRKLNKKTKRTMFEPFYTIKESGVIDSPYVYEIELELMENEVTDKTTVTDLKTSLKKCVKYILCGLQETNFPIGQKEQLGVWSQYSDMIHSISEKEKLKYNENKEIKLFPKHFIGPTSMTLQMINIMKLNVDEINVPNIRKNYSVTDKADGIRKLLIIDKNGLIYLMNMGMDVQFTGTKTTNEKIFNTILDGEHILHDKHNTYINLFAAFDVYFINNKDIRMLKLHDNKDDNRLKIMNEIISNIKSIHVMGNDKLAPLRIEMKRFFISNDEDGSIFKKCDDLLTLMDNSEYNTDGIIFTPIDKGVGMEISGEKKVINHKQTWKHSFKFKPPEYNSNDFLVTFVKNKDGSDVVINTTLDGIDVNENIQIVQYKVVNLRVGYNEREHGYANPCGDVYNNILPTFEEDNFNLKNYKPAKFIPTDPYDPEAYICHIKLDSMRSNKMYTEEDDLIEDNMIVEFIYDMNDPDKYKRWKPLRARYDKTAEFRAGYPTYGNAYHVANSNWQSIHNPITFDMLKTGENIPKYTVDNDVYYNKTYSSTNTQGLRDFHNLYVKRALISNVNRNLISRKNESKLIDFAVGKGGDLSKWIDGKYSFVFGIDISRDNIENRVDGACARYLNYLRKTKNMPSCLFVQGDSSKNIKSTDAINSSKGKSITNAVFGIGHKDKQTLGEGVYNAFGVGISGFDVSSIQFALHYMFENKTTLYSFIKNVQECTKLNGYFIGTCYDGKLIHKKLLKKDSISIYDNDTNKKIWEIQKQYNKPTINDDDTSLGYKINVYQESINKYAVEYLVNFDYFINVMELFGFRVLNKHELTQINLSKSCDSFYTLFNKMNGEYKRNEIDKVEYNNAVNMTNNEKNISFLNRYFIFKKIAEMSPPPLTKEDDKVEEQDKKEYSLSGQEYSKAIVTKTGSKVFLSSKKS